MPGPTLTFLGGVREIGGNKILLKDGPDTILFDFGPSFSGKFEQFYINFLKPRSTSPVKDLLEFDLIPRVEGLYSAEALTGAELRPKPPEIHGIFVTHAHYDHAGHLDLVDPEIPVFVGPTMKQVMDAIDSSSPGGMYGTHDFRIVEDGKPVRLGNLEVTPYPVDHSIPGARGYLIHTSEGSVAYTGDFRRHGPRAADSDAFVDRLRVEPPNLFITEGTRVGPDPRKNHTESGVRDSVTSLLQHSSHPAFACHYPRDVDRIATLYAAARAGDRELLVSTKTAHLLTALAGFVEGADVPVPGKSPGVRVYRRSKSRFFKWEQVFLDDAVDAEYVRQQGPKVLVSLELSHFAELIDLQPPKGSPFIHSMSEPFSEDDVDDQVLHNWIDHFGLGFHQLHASGHASQGELKEICRSVAPKAVVPVHTEHPEDFEKFGPRIILVERNVPIPIPV